MRKLVYILFFLSLSLSLNAQIFATRELSEISKLVSANKGDLSSGRHILPGKNFSYTVRYDSLGYVTHIGADIFPKMSINGKLKALCDFAERYWLYLRLLDPIDRNIIIRDCKLEVIADELFTVDSLCSFSVNQSDDKYSFVWTRDSAQVCSMSFRKDYGLIRGQNLIETQQSFYMDVQDTSLHFAGNVNVPSDNFEKMDSVEFFVHKGENYVLPEMNSDTYFKKDGVKFKPLNSSDYPVETLANIFAGLVRSDIEVKVAQNMYGYQKMYYNIRLQRLVDFCIGNGCTPFFGVESVGKDIKATIIYMNTDFSYNHLVFITVDSDFLKRKDCVMEATIHSYIPTHEMKGIYLENNDIKSKKK